MCLKRKVEIPSGSSHKALDIRYLSTCEFLSININYRLSDDLKTLNSRDGNCKPSQHFQEICKFTKQIRQK